jgi:hypothetical protein
VFDEATGGTMLHVLADGNKVPRRIASRDNPLRIEFLTARLKFIKALVHHQITQPVTDRYRRTPLMIACMYNNVDSVTVIRLLTKNDKTAINIVCRDGHSALTRCCMHGDVKMIKELLLLGANPLQENRIQNVLFFIKDNVSKTRVDILNALVENSPELLDKINIPLKLRYPGSNQMMGPMCMYYPLQWFVTKFWDPCTKFHTAVNGWSQDGAYNPNQDISHFHDKRPTATDVATVDWFVLKGALVVPPGADSGGGYGTKRIRDNVIQEIDYAIDVRASYNLELSDLRDLKNFLELISDKQQSVDSDIDTGLS